MKTKPKPKLLLNILDSQKHRHHVAATITSEGEWNAHEPNSGVARTFVVMLVLHVFVVGGIVFHDFFTKSGEEEVRVAPAAKAMLANAAAAPSTEQKYTVQSGDSVPRIVAHLGVDKDAFVALNQLGSDDVQISTGTVLRVPEKIADAPLDVVIAQSLPAAATVTPTTLEPRTEPVAETTSVNVPPAAMSLTLPEENNSTVPLDEPPAPMLAKIDSLDETVVAATEPPAPVEPVIESAPPPAPVTPKARSIAPPPNPVPKPSEMAKRPIVKPTAPVAAKPSAKTAAPATSHVLAKGETLYRLASKYGVSIDALIKANKIKDPAKMRDGMKLVIPAKQ